MKVGIVGAGEISNYHLDVLRTIDSVKVVAICDADINKARYASSKYGIEKAYADYAKMIQASHPDVVHILAPPKFHKDMAIYAMNNGCHALVEKPMALRYEDALAMVEVSEASGKRLCVCEIYHFDPAVIRARELLRNGTIGELFHVETYWFTNLTDRSNAYSVKSKESGWAYRLPGGVFCNFIDHPVYLQRDFLGQVDNVSSVAKKFGNNPFVQYDELRVNLESREKTGQLVASANGKPRINILRLYGTEGIITADISNMYVTVLKNRNLPSFMAKGIGNLSMSYKLMRDTFVTTSRVLTNKLQARQGLADMLKKYYACQVKNNFDNDDKDYFDGRKAADTIRIINRIWDTIPLQKDMPVAPGSIYLNARSNASSNSTESARDKKVLVTGAGGFLGKSLVKELAANNFSVRILTRKNVNPIELNVDYEICYGDIRNPDTVEKALNDIDIVYHCASITTNKGTWKDFTETNIEGTRNLLEASVKLGVKKFVFVSSVIVYGFDGNREQRRINELDNYGNNFPRYSYYAKSKIETEKLVKDYHENTGLPTVIIRPGIIFGPGGKNIFSRKQIIFGAKNKILPFIYVQDVVKALLLAGSSETAVGRVYNVVGDEQISQGEFHDKVVKVCKAKTRGHFLPVPVMFLAAFGLETIFTLLKSDSTPPFSMYHYKSLTRNLAYDNSRIKHELAWEPSVGIEDGIRLTLKSTE